MAAPLDLFAPQTAPALVLLGTRVSGLVLIAPTLASKLVPMKVRTGLVVLFTLLLAPVAMTSVTGVPALTPAAIVGEALVGFALGLGAAIVIGGAEMAGEAMANQIGLSGAALFDPLNNTQVPALSQFMQLTALAFVLTSGLHVVLLESVAASTQVAPLGAPLALAEGMRAAAGLVSQLFLLGLRLAAPVMAVVLVGNVALAILSRAAPQLNILSVAFPLQIGIGLLTLAAAFPYLATVLPGWTGLYDALTDTVLRALLGGG